MSNSPEVIKFMQLFQKLKDWSDDDPESLPELASGDEYIKDVCLNLLKAAGNLQRNERGNRELFTSPVDPKFVTAWREFERRFGHALLVVRSNAVEAGESNLIFSFDWYEQPADWKDADFDAADTVRAIEGMIDFAIDFARSQAD